MPSVSSFASKISSHNQVLMMLGSVFLRDNIANIFGLILWIIITVNRYYENRTWNLYSYFITVPAPLLNLGSAYTALSEVMKDFQNIRNVFLAITLVTIIFRVIFVRWSIKKKEPQCNLKFIRR